MTAPGMGSPAGSPLLMGVSARSPAAHSNTAAVENQYRCMANTFRVRLSGGAFLGYVFAHFPCFLQSAHDRSVPQTRSAPYARGFPHPPHERDKLPQLPNLVE